MTLYHLWTDYQNWMSGVQEILSKIAAMAFKEAIYRLGLLWGTAIYSDPLTVELSLGLGWEDIGAIPMAIHYCWTHICWALFISIIVEPPVASTCHEDNAPQMLLQSILSGFSVKTRFFQGNPGYRRLMNIKTSFQSKTYKFVGFWIFRYYILYILNLWYTTSITIYIYGSLRRPRRSKTKLVLQSFVEIKC